jgi:DNA polymerase III subunit delta'
MATASRAKARDPTVESPLPSSIEGVSAVLERVPGQDSATAFLIGAAERPHHAYVFAGPEGSGKSLGARAFAAALLCHDGGCGECRDCRLALGDRHPNEFLIEPEGRDIHVDTIREQVWQPAYRTAPEPGRKVFVIREADRLSPAAADTLLKVLEEPPADAVFLLMSARAHELPETVLSRCHLVTFTALSEAFVVEALVAEGISDEKARLAARLCGGNLGRARRLATATDGLAFRDAARTAISIASEGAPGALEAAEVVLAAAGEYKKGLKAELEGELSPFLDEKGRPEDSYRGAIRRIEERFHRKERRAERDYVDWVLLGMSSLLRDRIVVVVGGTHEVLMNPDLESDERLTVLRAARGMAGIEEARAELAEDLNLNTRLVLERAFLRLAEVPA